MAILIKITPNTKATKALKDANDCPTNCKCDHCDECPFRVKSTTTTAKSLSTSKRSIKT